MYINIYIYIYIEYIIFPCVWEHIIYTQILYFSLPFLFWLQGYDLLQQRKEVTLRADAEERVHVRRGDLGGKTGVVFQESRHHGL